MNTLKVILTKHFRLLINHMQNRVSSGLFKIKSRRQTILDVQMEARLHIVDWETMAISMIQLG